MRKTRRRDALQYYVPRNSGYLSAVYTGLPNFEIEPRLLLVGPRPAYDFYGSAGNVTWPDTPGSISS